MRVDATLFRWLAAGETRAHPGRTATAIAAIAIGVALGFGVHLINRSALAEFAQAVRATTGEADVELRGMGLAVRQGFDDAAFDALLALREVAHASPVVEIDAPAIAGSRRLREPLRLLGIDPLRAAAINPGFVGRVAPELDTKGIALEPFDERAIFMSPAALEWLGVSAGDTIELASGVDTVPFIVAGTIAGAAPGQRIAVIDIAAAQTRFRREGRLSRIDVRLAPGATAATLASAIANVAALADLALVAPDADEARASNVSRAYRVNLNVLAMMALFTGAFLVYSVQTLAVVRRRATFALLRIVGLARRGLVMQVLAEGLALGAIGAVGGIVAGGALAAAVLQWKGGDLGGGYFAGSSPSLVWSWAAAFVYAALGIAAAALGSVVPAIEAARAHPARALKTGSEAHALSRVAHPWIALAIGALGIALTFAPAVGGIPVAGYVAVALMLLAGIAAMPSIAHAVARRAAARFTRGDSTVLALASARVANAPGEIGVVLSGVLASFALMVAMAIMVASFRSSVDEWLSIVLPADLYVRPASGGDTAFLPTDMQQRISSASGVARAEFSRFVQLSIDPTRPNVTLIARELGEGAPGMPPRRLPITGEVVAVDGLALYVSEPMVDYYGYKPGVRVTLPIRDARTAGRVTGTVAGVWRDYARQSGAIAMSREAYRSITGDDAVTDVALWVAPGTRAADVVANLRAVGGDRIDVIEVGALRAISLAIFDRSFAVTYMLEVVAMAIGLFGVATAFGAQALARAKEFGMLRHVGVTRREIFGLLAAEGTLLAAIGIAAGFALGGAVSLVLIRVINPQSFHWTMDVHVPWALLAAIGAALLLCAAVTARVAGRAAASGSAVRAVSEDW